VEPGDAGKKAQTRILILHLDVATHAEVKQMVEDLRKVLKTRTAGETVALAVRQTWAIHVD
jgi:hypothetical protein